MQDSDLCIIIHMFINLYARLIKYIVGIGNRHNNKNLDLNRQGYVQVGREGK